MNIGNNFTVMALAIIFVLVVICFILNISNSLRISKIMQYSDDGDLAGSLKDYYAKVKDLSKTINNATDAVLMSRLDDCESNSNISIKKIGIVNFDAFDDVTGKMSFALALLNSHNDGVIITSIYGHNSCNTYLREVTEGETPVKLLNEEKEALEKAKNKLKKADK